MNSLPLTIDSPAQGSDGDLRAEVRLRLENLSPFDLREPKTFLAATQLALWLDGKNPLNEAVVALMLDSLPDIQT